MLTMRQRIAVSCEVRNRYRKAAKKVKSQILSEFVKTTGYNRSYARYILGSLKKAGRKKKYSPRRRIYNAQVFYKLKKLWIAADCICGQRLRPFLPELIDRLEYFKEIKLNKTIRKKLLTMGSATIDRILAATRRSYAFKKGKSTTRPGTLLKSMVAVRTYADWNDDRPGYFETDLVAFCGDRAEGEYVNGLNLTDVAIGWVGLEVVMGKAQFRVHKAIDTVRNRLPYKMLGLDPDNGTEFINWLLKRYCENHSIAFTRIRPGKKNDNCFVEQKNYTVLRRFVGYGRYDTEKQLMIIKDLLPVVEDYVNFFQPNQKLKEKMRIGSKTKKSYYTATTPYRKLLASGVLSEKEKLKLNIYYESLNPMELKRIIHKLQQKLYKTLR